MTIKNMESSGNNEWETPPEIFKYWDDIFHFQGDVCATEENAKCPAYYTPFLDGLSSIREWWRTNWLNPPYGRGLIEPWLKRASAESKVGKLTVALLPVSPATQWWQQYVTQADHIFYYPHRINFLRNKQVVKGVSFDPCIIIWGMHP